MLDDKEVRNENEIEIKAILIGESGVGKTSLINVCIGNPFNEGEKPTISNTFAKKIFEINSKKYIIDLWDTAGQERYRNMAKLFYKDAHIVIFVYDITNENSFNSLKDYWIKEVEEYLGDMPICGIVGNKKDLYFDESVKEATVKEYADSKNIKYKIVSAKNEPNGFNEFIEELLKDSKPFEVSLEKIKLENINIKKSKCKC